MSELIRIERHAARHREHGAGDGEPIGVEPLRAQRAFALRSTGSLWSGGSAANAVT